MGIIKKDLPSLDELKKLGVEARLDSDKESKVEALLERRGYPKFFPYAEPSLRKHLWYRLVRWFIGGWFSIGTQRHYQKGYGWALIVGALIFIAIVSSLVQAAAGALYIVLFVIGSLVGIILANSIYSKKYFSITQFQLKGVETPIAYHIDANGNKVIDYITSDQTMLTSHIMPIEAMQGIIGINVREFASKDGSPSLLATRVMRNVIWGDEKFSHLDLTQFLFLERPGSINPPALQDAMNSLKRAVDKRKMDPEDAENVRELITRAYNAMEEWKQAMSEIRELTGKKFVRMKMSKEFEIYLADLPNSLRQLRAKEEELVRKAADNSSETILEPLNKAIRISTEFGTSLEQLKIQYEERGRKLGRLETLNVVAPKMEIAELAAKSEMAETARKASVAQEAIDEFSLRKKLEEMTGEDSDGEED